MFGQPILGQHHRSGAEGVGLDNIGAGGEETVVQLADLIGTRADQVLVAAFELWTAEVGRAEMHVLDGGPRGAIDDDDSRGQGIAQKLDSLQNSSHARYKGPAASAPAYPTEAARAISDGAMSRMFCI